MFLFFVFKADEARISNNLGDSRLVFQIQYDNAMQGGVVTWREPSGYRRRSTRFNSRPITIIFYHDEEAFYKAKTS